MRSLLRQEGPGAGQESLSQHGACVSPTHQEQGTPEPEDSFLADIARLAEVDDHVVSSMHTGSQQLTHTMSELHTTSQGTAALNRPMSPGDMDGPTLFDDVLTEHIVQGHTQHTLPAIPHPVIDGVAAAALQSNFEHNGVNMIASAARFDQTAQGWPYAIEDEPLSVLLFSSPSPNAENEDRLLDWDGCLNLDEGQQERAHAAYSPPAHAHLSVTHSQQGERNSLHGELQAAELDPATPFVPGDDTAAALHGSTAAQSSQSVGSQDVQHANDSDRASLSDRNSKGANVATLEQDFAQKTDQDLINAVGGSCHVALMQSVRGHREENFPYAVVMASLAILLQHTDRCLCLYIRGSAMVKGNIRSRYQQAYNDLTEAYNLHADPGTTTAFEGKHNTISEILYMAAWRVGCYQEAVEHIHKAAANKPPPEKANLLAHKCYLLAASDFVFAGTTKARLELIKETYDEVHGLAALCTSANSNQLQRLMILAQLSKLRPIMEQYEQHLRADVMGSNHADVNALSEQLMGQLCVSADEYLQ